MRSLLEDGEAIVFVDIDGVLNTPDDYARLKTLPPDDRVELLFNPQLVARLNRITEVARASLVVSSSWRLYYNGREGNPSFDDLRRILGRVGVTAEVVGPTLPEEPRRWEAIEAWVANHGGRFAILDDDVPPDDWRWRAHHVHCLSLPGGLTEENERLAIKLLTEGP